MKHFHIPLITTLIAVCSSNIWDNVFSHLHNDPPSISLPSSFAVQFNDTTMDKLFGNVTVSSDLNKIRVVINSNEKLNSFTIVLTLDFTEGAVYAQNNDECFVIDNRDLSRITVQFLLKSYDLFTYFEHKRGYYYYVISDLRWSNFHKNMEEVVTYKNVEELPAYVRLKFRKKDMKLLEIKYKLKIPSLMPYNIMNGVLTPIVLTDYQVTEEDFLIFNKTKCIRIRSISDIVN